MTIHQLRGILEDAGVDVSTEELLDVLWLAVTTGPAVPEAEGDVMPAPAGTAEPGRYGDGRAGTGDVLPRERNDARGAADGSGRKAPAPAQALYAPGGGAGRRRARHVDVRGVRAVPGVRSLYRALRPLRRPVPSRTSFVLDETATADLIADTGLPDLVLRPAAERWLDAVLIVDDGPSMVLWRQYAAETRALLERQGLFHRVRTYGLDSSEAGRPVLRSRPFHASAARVSARRLTHGVRPTVVLVLSDGVGPAWASGATPELLRRWAVHSPVAVVQPLPRRLWPADGMPVEDLCVTAPGPALPSGSLQVRHPVLPADLVAYEGPAIPVLELEETLLGSWTRLLLGGGATATLPLLTWTDPESYGSGPAGPERGEGRSAQELLRGFRRSASPESRRLAGALAAVRPLTLPVMRLVHRAEPPGPGRYHPSQLAEVFLGGLLRKAEGRTGAAGTDGAEYEFLPGVTDLLLDTVPTSHALDTAARVSDYLMRRAGAGLEFRAKLGGDGGPSSVGAAASPFAAASPELLRRLGLVAELPDRQDRRGQDGDDGGDDGGNDDGNDEAEDTSEETESGAGEDADADGERVSLAHVWPRMASFVRRLRDDERTPGIVRDQARNLGTWIDQEDAEGAVLFYIDGLASALVASRQHTAVAELRELLRDCMAPFLDDERLQARNIRGHSAIALSTLGETAEAAEHMRDIIAISSRVHGEEHGYTLNARSFLHDLYWDADRLAEAEAEGRVLIAVLERLPRTDPLLPDYGRVQLVQSSVHAALNRPAAAHAAARAAYDERVARLGPEAAETLYARARTASRLLDLRRAVEAEREARAVLAALDRVGAGPQPPAARASYDGARREALEALAKALREAERFAEVVAVRRAALEAALEHGGPAGLQQVLARRLLASALRRTGDLDAAQETIEEAVALARSVLGEDHLETLLCRELAAMVLARRGRFEEAVEQHRAVLEQGRRILGEDDAFTLDFRHNLGVTLLDARRHDEAEGVLRSALEDHVRILGYEHGNTRMLHRWHARALQRMGRAEEAERRLRALIESEEALPEGGGIAAGVTRTDLGKVLLDGRRFEEAVEQYTRAWELWREALGAEAPATLAAAHGRGRALTGVRRWQEAADVLRGVAEARALVLGPEHPDTLWSRQWQGLALARLGRRAEAEELWRGVQEVAVRRWGEDHGLAVAARTSLSEPPEPGEAAE
ncbi:SAV_2336 N-terminal domain-related protein [Streptomyces sp. NPDC053493]|uniref:SAV_2336 N-terminal domain-related protein n=1 Tax=Streptomyces sp. NPDC053493 TaxID=3365705 RepID=UPI0037D3E9A7